MPKLRKLTALLLVLICFSAIALTGCRESERVSYNLSQEADNFNVTRQLTVFNTRNSDILFQMTGNFSIEKEADGDLAVIGENPNGTYYKHFVLMSRDITYTVIDIGTTTVDRYQFTINFNPNMAIPVDVATVD